MRPNQKDGTASCRKVATISAHSEYAIRPGAVLLKFDRTYSVASAYSLLLDTMYSTPLAGTGVQ